jgi:hypothetical protein
MKSPNEVMDELYKLRQLLWYVDWLKWHFDNPIERLEASAITAIYNPAMLFADTIDHAYRDEIDTRHLSSASEVDKAKLYGQCVALAWTVGTPLKELEALCGSEKGVPMPKLPGVWEQ